MTENGNIAAMREALVQCELFLSNVFRHGHPTLNPGDKCTACAGVDELRGMVVRALSSPTSNCDASGNVAAMRDALNNVGNATAWVAENCNDQQTAKYMNDIIAMVQAALSEPPRNCDVGTPEEQARRFDTFCSAHHFQSEKCCSGCPCQGAECEFKWSQMPYDKE